MYVLWRTTPVIHDGVDECRNMNAVGARVMAERGVYAYNNIYYYVYNVIYLYVCVFSSFQR